MCRVARQLLTALLLLFAVRAHAQGPLSQEDSERISQALRGKMQGEKLPCEVNQVKPFLDFSFRYDSGYVASCPVNAFFGKESTLISYLRVAPLERQAIVLAEAFRLPAIPENLKAQTKLSRVRSEVEFSGGFAVGEGQYEVQILIVDNLGRSYEKHWRLKVARRRSERNVELAMQPSTAAPLSTAHFRVNTTPGKDEAPRVTILLDAAPIYPFAQKLRAWDREFLLSAVSSVLRTNSYKSVKLVAFNLDQQREIFRTGDFSHPDFQKLSDRLRTLELGTISYKVLGETKGWAELLASLVNEEAAMAERSDAVIFLGPTNRIGAKVPTSMLRVKGQSQPRFYYFEYYPQWLRGREMPDAIHHLTDDCNGRIMRIHSPSELAQAIQKVQSEIRTP